MKRLLPSILTLQHFFFDKSINALRKFEALRTVWQGNLNRKVHERIASCRRLATYRASETAGKLALEEFHEEAVVIVFVTIPFNIRDIG